MIGHTIDLLALVWPLVLAAICFLGALFPRTTFSKSGVLKLSVFEFLSFEQGIGKGFARVIFLVFAGAFLTVPAFRDYSSFFPEELKVAVFFDNQGIERFMEHLSEQDRGQFAIAHDWKAQKALYFARVNQELKAANVPFEFREVPGQTSASGEVKFRVRMISRWGAQHYRIIEAKGSLVHTTETPGTTASYRIVSEFDLLQTEGAIIAGSIRDVYLNHGLLIMPEFKQLFRISPTKEIYYGPMVAATRVDIFPYINISKTLYLVPQADGTNIPVAYGVYSSP